MTTNESQQSSQFVTQFVTASQEWSLQRSLQQFCNNFQSTKPIQNGFLRGTRSLPLNSGAKFSLIKTIGYKGLSQVCNSFVNQVTQDAHFINHYFLYLSVFYLFLGYKACNCMQSIICPKQGQRPTQRDNKPLDLDDIKTIFSEIKKYRLF